MHPTPIKVDQHYTNSNEPSQSMYLEHWQFLAPPKYVPGIGLLTRSMLGGKFLLICLGLGPDTCKPSFLETAGRE